MPSCRERSLAAAVPWPDWDRMTGICGHRSGGNRGVVSGSAALRSVTARVHTVRVTRIGGGGEGILALC